jgi:hypothetical protein
MRYFVPFFCLVGLVQAALVGDVRAALARKDVPAAEALIKSYRDKNGVTPEMLEAFSWFGRVALADKRYDDAERNAIETRRLVLEQLKTKQLDKDPNLPIALGAAIEVQGHVLAARGERDQAVDYLRRELAAYRKSTIVATRTQKNIHLLSHSPAESRRKTCAGVEHARLDIGEAAIHREHEGKACPVVSMGALVRRL